MKMSVFTNNQSGIPYTQYGTDKQKARATKFAQADNKELAHLANRINNRKDSNRKFNKNVARTITALPLIAGAAAMIATKGKVSTKTIAGAKRALGIGAAMAGIGAVFSANRAIANNSPKVANTERKHPLLTLVGLSAIASGALTGASAILGKVSPKVTESITKIAKKNGISRLVSKAFIKMNKAPEAIRTMASNVASKISLPKNVKEHLSTIAGKIKMPQILKDGYGKIANAENTKKTIEMAKGFGKAIGKFAIKNPIATTLFTLSALAVAHGVKQAIETNKTKNQLKDAQLRTANGLINAYAAENDSLKTANAKAADALEKSNNVIAEEANKQDEE